MKKKDVLIVFKTHLDVGFTDYAERIVEKYLSEYIPNAIRVGRELQGTDTPFIWTVGSFLIWQALKHDSDGSVEGAVRDGILNWHALPFTTHTELMSKKLFEYGMDVSAMLDSRFGRTTVGAKMTDVPGHTVGMVPIMSGRGVKFLHIGVNPATPLPPVPPVFRWVNGDSEIVVMYQGDYGLDAEFDDFVVCFAHTNDNLGPQSAKEIVEIYRKIGERYPDCALRAATLNDVAERVCALKGLPTVTGEIGDTWIHGAATDPQKLSRYRRLLRRFDDSGSSVDLTDSLLLIPEHTFGMDLKTFFKNDSAYTHREIESADGREIIERSWDEQREYAEKAERALKVECEYPISEPELTGYKRLSEPVTVDIEISWELFDRRDYERYSREYLRSHVDWAIRDFTKVGLPEYEGGVYAAKVVDCYLNGKKILMRLSFGSELEEKYGLPYFWLETDGERVDIRWFGKHPSRLPQAFWVKFKGLREDWEIGKLGEWIRPESVIGSPFICATDAGVRNGEVYIEPLDSALVAPYGRKLLRYGEPTGNQDLYFCLYDNIWNTNFPMWYSDDAMFRFNIRREQ